MGNYTLQSPFGPTSELRFGQKFEGKLSHLLSSTSTMAIVKGGVMSTQIHSAESVLKRELSTLC